MKKTTSSSLLAAVVLSGIALPLSEAHAQTRSFTWSGLSWTVRDTGTATAGPRSNMFAGRNVTVDSQGLHLIAQKNASGQWTAAEVYTTNPTGYGTYTWEVTNINEVSVLKGVVLGLFTYANDRNELDFETGYFGGPDGDNGWNSVQPTSKSFTFSGTEWDTSRHTIQYNTSEAIFTNKALNTTRDVTILQRFSSRIPRPTRDTRAHMNLWFLGGAVSDLVIPGGRLEVLVKSFSYTKL